MHSQSILPRNEQMRIEAECELLSRWFPQRFPSVLIRAIEQGTIHGGLFVANEHEGDPYGHLTGLPVKWQQAAQLARGVIAALEIDGADMTPLQRFVATVRPRQMRHSSKPLMILYDDILPKYLQVPSSDEQPTLETIVSRLDVVPFLQSKLGQHATCWPIQGHLGCAMIETPFQLPNGKPINFYADGRSDQLVFSDDSTVLDFLLLCCSEEWLPASVDTWITTICTEKRVEQTRGRFVVHVRKEEDVLVAIQRLIEVLLQIAALRCLLS